LGGECHTMVAVMKNNLSVLIGLTIVVGVVVVGDIAQRVRWPTSYIYAPGLFGSPVVIGRYCSVFRASTGEVVYGTRGGDIFGDGTRVTPVVFGEIDVQRPRGWFRRAIAPSIIRSIFLSRFGITVRENEESDTTIFNYIFDVRFANIAQKEDIEALKENYAIHVARYPNTNIVLFGDSRGAATVFNFIAMYHPTAVRCMILEGIFDTIPHLLSHCFYCSWKGDFIENVLHTMLIGCAQKYCAHGPFPGQYVDQIPGDIPILLVTSLMDEVVPYQSTMRLYQLLKAQGHTRVHLLVLQKSHHDSYMVGIERDVYQSCVHAFYKEVGVAYDPVWATRGEDIFAKTSPSSEELTTHYMLTKQCCCV